MITQFAYASFAVALLQRWRFVNGDRAKPVAEGETFNWVTLTEQWGEFLVGRGWPLRPEHEVALRRYGPVDEAAIVLRNHQKGSFGGSQGDSTFVWTSQHIFCARDVWRYIGRWHRMEARINGWLKQRKERLPFLTTAYGMLTTFCAGIAATLLAQFLGRILFPGAR